MDGWLAIIIIIIIIIIVIVLILSKTKRSHKSITKKMSKRSNPLCDMGSKLEDEICKKDTLQPCDYSSECLFTDLCFNGKCIPRPSNYSEKMLTNYSLKDSKLNLNRHLLVLDGDTIRPIQWDLCNCRWVCPYSSSLTAVLCDSRLYLINKNMQITAKLKLKRRIDTIFKRKKQLYATSNGHIYILRLSENHVLVENIGKYDLTIKKSREVRGLKINKWHELIEDGQILMENANQVFYVNGNYWIISSKKTILI